MSNFSQFLNEEASNKLYHVFISKSYFPNSSSKKIGQEDFEQWKIKASSREDAAKKVWKENGPRLLKLMKPNQSKLPRKVSLFVNSPDAGTGGNAGRLNPILVYTDPLNEAMDFYQDFGFISPNGNIISADQRYDDMHDDIALRLGLKTVTNALVKSYIRFYYTGEAIGIEAVKSPSVIKNIIKFIKGTDKRIVVDLYTKGDIRRGHSLSINVGDPETAIKSLNQTLEEEVSLNKPFRGGTKKFRVNVKNPDTGNIVKVDFGDPNMEIKRDDPARRKSFRARHGCDKAKDKTTAKYWSCQMWRDDKSVQDILDEDFLIERDFYKDFGFYNPFTDKLLTGNPRKDDHDSLANRSLPGIKDPYQATHHAMENDYFRWVLTADGGLMIDALDIPKHIKAVDKVIQKFGERTKKDVIIHLKRPDGDFTLPDRMFDFESVTDALSNFDKVSTRRSSL